MPSHKRKRSEYSTSSHPSATTTTSLPSSSTITLAGSSLEHPHFRSTNHLQGDSVASQHSSMRYQHHHPHAGGNVNGGTTTYFNPRTGQSSSEYAPPPFATTVDGGSSAQYTGPGYPRGMGNGSSTAMPTPARYGHHHGVTQHSSRSPLPGSYHHQHNSQQQFNGNTAQHHHHLPVAPHHSELPSSHTPLHQSNTLAAPHVVLSPQTSSTVRHASKRRRFSSPVLHSAANTTNTSNIGHVPNINHSNSAFHFNHQHQQQQQYQRNYRPHNNSYGSGHVYTPRYHLGGSNNGNKRYSTMSTTSAMSTANGSGSHSSIGAVGYSHNSYPHQHNNYHSTNTHHSSNAGWNGYSSYRSRRGGGAHDQYSANSYYNKQHGYSSGKGSNYSKSNYHSGGGSGNNSARYNQHSSHDDKDGHYRFTIGEVLLNQYKITSFMGAGTFAKVVKCIDIFQNRYVAIKIIRSLRKYTEAAQIEINVLNDIKDRDLDDQFHCIRLLRSFTFRGHMCLVFPLYGTSIFDFMKKNNYIGFTMTHIQNIALQLFRGIQFIHDELRLIHTDLKPENVLLMQGEFDEIPLPPTATPKKSGTTTMRVPKCTDIKIIDFGSATYERDYHTAIISTRHYRAPEVILGLGWSYPADMWSAGCILFELYTGDALFQTHENKEHLAMMEKYFGAIPHEIFQRIDRATKKKYFVQNGRLNWPAMASNEESVSFVSKLKPMADSLHVSTHGEVGNAFLDLIGRLLQYEPTDRLTAKEALQHRFFSLVH
mmetsp:Transcript_174/g.610  ORF Transcript_174/g.610 Transcript_174/m.610 type:complete len:762 (-) Transcript_174:124-2409(-)|eukprot:CAMPEP_0117452002 /NCGR_PEP_ID=MMETSP0759-20121206/9339_1 /TAXON_ID=63605 /ORGANISM="Percolomonas cosmopolitus, Strain WS" /LENGTH=761 /DNA_ID=CAMNT_0005244701 /DNA_START=486 /DNA_END=2771 /DNA_ORIENTATION=-